MSCNFLKPRAFVYCRVCISDNRLEICSFTCIQTYRHLAYVKFNFRPRQIQWILSINKQITIIIKTVVKFTKDTFQLWTITVLPLHSLDHHRRYINVHNLFVTIINHAFTERCNHEKKKKRNQWKMEKYREIWRKKRYQRSWSRTRVATSDDEDSVMKRNV